jgi:hypothetical protein
MTDQEIDEILAGESKIEPSPGFAAGVMRAVHHDATTPPPIGFPWLCALPGFLAWGITIALLLAVPWFNSNVRPASAFHLHFDISMILARLTPLFDLLKQLQVGWIALAVILTVACVTFPLRLIRGGFRN